MKDVDGYAATGNEGGNREDLDLDALELIALEQYYLSEEDSRARELIALEERVTSRVSTLEALEARLIKGLDALEALEDRVNQELSALAAYSNRATPRSQD